MNQFYVYLPGYKFADFEEFVVKAGASHATVATPDDQYGWHRIVIPDDYLLEFKILYGEWANEV